MRITRPDDLLTPERAGAVLGLTSRTLRHYTDIGKLPDRRGPGNRRLFLRSDLEALRAERLGHSPSGAVVLYARVSSHRQEAEGDLEHQLGRLRAAAAGRTVRGEFTDVASGLSDNRRGLAAALAACADPGVTDLLVTHPERLARFGAGPMRQLLGALGVSLVVTGEDADIGDSAESALVRDMLSIVTSFSGRLYGRRSARARALARTLCATAAETTEASA